MISTHEAPRARLDPWLPAFHHVERHAIVVRAGRARVLEAVETVRGREIAGARWLLGLRSLPARLAGRPGLASVAGAWERPILEGMVRQGFVLLERTPDAIVVGVVGRFWRPIAGELVRLEDPRAFLAFSTPGFAKAAMGFTLEPAAADGGAERTLLRTETRIEPLGGGARRRFAAYWLLVRPGSGWLRRAWLRAVQRRAEAG